MNERPIDYHEMEENFPEDSAAASATELTGLSYRTPQSDAEWEALRELFPMETPAQNSTPKKRRKLRDPGM